MKLAWPEKKLRSTKNKPRKLTKGQKLKQAKIDHKKMD